MKKVVIIGPESTGKSTLARQLAEHYKAPWVPESAREYLDQLTRPYEESDLLKIAQEQWAREQQAAKNQPPWLFCDTDLRVIKIWSEYKYGHTHSWILEQINRSSCDLYLLTDIDLPWEPDPQREHPHQREELLGLYLKELTESGYPFKRIQGVRQSRFQQALQALQALRL
ncbi:MAG: ATP-binding protein [Cyclobacteriaceae bacterium]|nr:ATP-binding protein [Cyclobacteriaceae bacterium]